MPSTELDNRTAKVADLIIDELARLGVGTDDNAYSGLTTEVPNIVTDEVIIKVYDDYDSGFYKGEELLAHLKTLDKASVSLDGIWQAIAPFEA